MVAQKIRGSRRVKEGTVIGNKMEKTVVVLVERLIQHPRYKKVITHKQKLYAHAENGAYNVGDQVTVVETRPMSKLKRWRVVEPAEQTA